MQKENRPPFVNLCNIINAIVKVKKLFYVSFILSPLYFTWNSPLLFRLINCKSFTVTSCWPKELFIVVIKHAGYVFVFISATMNPFVAKAALPTAWLPTHFVLTSIGRFSH